MHVANPITSHQGKERLIEAKIKALAEKDKVLGENAQTIAEQEKEIAVLKQKTQGIKDKKHKFKQKPMIIETKYSIGDKIDINSYEIDNNACTFISMDIKVIENSKLEITYWYKRDKSQIKGRFSIIEDGKGNQIGFIYDY